MSSDAAPKSEVKKEEPKKEVDLQITEDDLFEDFPINQGKRCCPQCLHMGELELADLRLLISLFTAWCMAWSEQLGEGAEATTTTMRTDLSGLRTGTTRRLRAQTGSPSYVRSWTSR